MKDENFNNRITIDKKLREALNSLGKYKYKINESTKELPNYDDTIRYYKHINEPIEIRMIRYEEEEPFDYTKTNETYKLTVLEPENLKHFSTFGFVSWEIAQRNRLNLLHESKYTAKFILEEKIEYSKISGDGWAGEKTRIVNRIIETKGV